MPGGDWRNRAIEGEIPYVYPDSGTLKRNWAGEVENVSAIRRDCTLRYRTLEIYDQPRYSGLARARVVSVSVAQ